MKFLIILITLISLISCGIDIEHEIPDTKQTVVFGPDFEGAAAFCDERYEDAMEAEECFQNYVNYLSVDANISTDNIQSYCESQFEDQLDIDECIANFTGGL